MPAFDVFIFDMKGALVEQVIARFRDLEWAPLTRQAIDEAIPAERRGDLGVYLLGLRLTAEQVAASPWLGDAADAINLEDGGQIRPVYVGESRQSVHRRLSRHAVFVLERVGLEPGNLLFKTLAVPIFDSVRIEKELNNHYRTEWVNHDPASGWKGSGIGANEEGSGRASQRISKFDLRFPIDPLRPSERRFHTRPRPVAVKLETALRRLSRSAPYTITIAKADKGAPALRNKVTLPPQAASTLQACETILRHLGGRWHAAVSPKRIVFKRGTVPVGANVLNRGGVWPPVEAPWKGYILPPP